MKLFRVIVAVLAVVALSGCAKNVAEAILDANGVHVNSSGEGGTITLGDNKGTFAVGNDVKIPESFPKDVPLYIGAQVKTALTTGATQQVSLETADTVAKVGDFYKTTMVAAGWKVGADMASKDSVTLMLTKGNEQVSIIAGPASGKTDIVLQVTTGE